jgi:hypothetical protein
MSRLFLKNLQKSAFSRNGHGKKRFLCAEFMLDKCAAERYNICMGYVCPMRRAQRETGAENVSAEVDGYRPAE